MAAGSEVEVRRFVEVEVLEAEVEVVLVLRCLTDG
jgi:hypothetical protein